MTADPELLNRITVRADVFRGKPIVRDMRISAEHVLGMLAAGDTAEAILQDYPVLEAEEIQACLLFAYRSMGGEHVHKHMASIGRDEVPSRRMSGVTEYALHAD